MEYQTQMGSKYVINLKSGYYEISRNISEDIGYSKNAEEMKKYQMKPIYKGRLFDIIAESLYDSIGLFITGGLNAYSPKLAPVYLILHIKTPSKMVEYRYIKLNGPIDTFIFTNEFVGDENKLRIIKEWSGKMKSSELLKPFLNKDTDFLTWDPGKGLGSLSYSSVYGSANHLLPSGKDTEFIQMYDPEDDSAFEKSYAAYVGTLEIDPSDEYYYNILMSQYNKIIDKQLNKVIVENNYLYKNDPKYVYDVNLLSNKDYIENMPEDDAFRWSGYLTANRKEKNGLKIESKYPSRFKDIPQEPMLGDHELKMNSDDCIYLYEYVKKHYPDFYNKVEQIINDAEKEYRQKRHEAAEKQYNAGEFSKFNKKSAKQTHIDIIKAFLSYQEVYTDSVDDIETPEDLTSYFTNIFGYIAEYLSKLGSDRMTDAMNKKLNEEIKEHPKTGEHLISIYACDPYDVPIINNTMRIDVIKYNSEAQQFIDNLRYIIGYIFPTTVSETFKAQIKLKKGVKNMKLGLFAPKGRVTKLEGVLVKYPFNSIEMNYQLIPANKLQMANVDENGNSYLNSVHTQYGVNATEEVIKFKQMVFKKLVKCLTNEFTFEIKDKLWDTPVPPYQIYLKMDEDKLNAVIEEIKNDPTYKKIMWLYERYRLKEKERLDKYRSWRH